MRNSDKYNILNENIKASEVRLIDDSGASLGIVSLQKALTMSRSKGFDLLQVSPTIPNSAPTCKMLNYSKFKYSKQRKASESKKNQKNVVLKVVKLHPNISDHDYQVKLKSISEFIKSGDKVRLSVHFRGREIMHKEVGIALIKKSIDALQDIAKVDGKIVGENMTIFVLLVPR